MNLSQKAGQNLNMWRSLPLNNEERNSFESFVGKSDELEVEDAFCQLLDFGTGGLRGIMGQGTNRMNRFTVGLATQGLANYLKKQFKGTIKVAIAHDSRNKSPYFADIAGRVLSSNGIEAYLFSELRPTPELSFAIRRLGCQSGIVVTASHNPPEYNGYKVYWEDGAQVIAPHDKGIIEEVKAISDPSSLNLLGNSALMHQIGDDLDETYRSYLMGLLPDPDVIRNQAGLPIVFSSIHGTGITQVPQTLKLAGFEKVFVVKEQEKPDGDFPTVKSPNPEEKAALELALELGKEKNAALVMATDPDADRVGIAIPDPDGNFILLNGNQTGALMLHYLASTLKKKGTLPNHPYSVKTIVTSDLLCRISNSLGITCMETLTGFKYIAELIRKNEGSKSFLMGAEESYGYLFGTGVRDKDAIASCLMIAQMTAGLLEQGKTLYQYLGELYNEYGLYKEVLVSIVKKGVEGRKEITALMERLRKEGVESFSDEKVIKARDFQSLEERDVSGENSNKLDFPKSNVLQFIGEKGSVLSIRPSGTEPKIKFYYSKRVLLEEGQAWMEVFNQLDEPMKYTIQALVH